MPDPQPSVTIVIATTAEAKRDDDIRQAISSIRSASSSPVVILVYVNGNRFSPPLCSWLKEEADVEYLYSEVGSFPLALYEAKKHVRTTYFGFLDDDDELLPGSIDKRLEVFEQEPNIDAVIGNGVRNINGKEVVTQKNIEECRQDPLRSLLRNNGNWLASCAGLFKTSSFDNNFFADYAPYSEWTYAAYRIASLKKVGFTEQKTYRINYTDNSLSAGLDYTQGQYNCVCKVLKLKLPRDVKKALKSKAINFAHDVAHRALVEKQFWCALKFHLISLTSITGFRKYAMFTRYFMLNNDLD